MLTKNYLLSLLVLLSCTSFAQMTLNRDTSLIISENGSIFSSALAGGIDAAQFSEVDLNLDGTMDIVLFQSIGYKTGKITPFLNNNGNYIYAPEYRSNFPDTLQYWMLMADYNCDGKNDIYTYSSGGVAIYENTSTNTLSFSLVTSLVLTQPPLLNGALGNIYISQVDIPAITDVDYDGDLDILTFQQSGGFVEYYKNMAIELTGDCDTVAFELSESCWGLFYEGLNNYILNCDSCQCPSITNFSSSTKEKHAGSTLLAIDIDNDNDKDLVLGDLSFNNLNLLINGGDNQNAHIVSVDTGFPQNHNNTIAANMNVYPASYYLDVTNDGVKDLIVTTNSQNNSENFESCWLYENAGQNNNPDFNFVQKDFLQVDMVELGTSAFPTFYDYNNDGLQDLVIGNYGYHNPNDPNPISSLALFENIGTQTIPRYNLVNRDWQNISNVNLDIVNNSPTWSISPTFGDMDADGDKDMLLGDYNGFLHYFSNQGGNFTITAPNYQNIDVGQFAQPQIVDVNRDGLLDIIIGEQWGNINYCPNTGTINSPIFDTVINNFGGIDVDTFCQTCGYSTPKLIDSSGVYQLFVGSYSGNIYQFTNIDGNLSGQFTPVSSTASNIWDGGKSAIAMADINNDSQPDMIIGNLSGGIAYFSSDTLLNDTTTNSTVFVEDYNAITMYPNPSKENLKVTSNQDGVVNIYDLLGNLIYTKAKTEQTISINTDKLKKGIYIVKLNKNIQKLVIR